MQTDRPKHDICRTKQLSSNKTNSQVIIELGDSLSTEMIVSRMRNIM